MYNVFYLYFSYNINICFLLCHMIKDSTNISLVLILIQIIIFNNIIYLTLTFLINVVYHKCKIQVSIRKDIYNLLGLNIKEDRVYIFQNVMVANNDGNIRATNQDYRLLMTRYYVVTYVPSEQLTTIGLTPLPIVDILKLPSNAKHLIGLIC